MAPLQPPQFSFPPIRYSPIQEAFRGALDVGMSELFQLPFQKMAQKRELQKYSQEQDIQRESELKFTGPMALAKQRSEIQTGQVVPGSSLDAETRSNLARAGAAAKYSLNGEDYYTPEALTGAKRYGLPVAKDIQGYIDDARKRMGFKGQSAPVTEGELPEVASAMGLEMPIREMQQREAQFEELRVDQRIQQLNTPGPEFMELANKIAFAQDPKNPGHLTRNFQDIFTFSKLPQYLGMLRDPIFQRPENAALRKDVEEKMQRALALAPQVRYATSFFPSTEDFNRSMQSMRTASPSEAITSEVAIAARLAARWNLLQTPDGKYVTFHGNDLDMAKAISALQSNDPLLQAMKYAMSYGSPDNMEWGGRNGAPYPTSQLVKDYLKTRVFPAMRGQSAGGIPGATDPSSPNYNPAGDIFVGPQYNEGGEGPAANQRTPPTPTSGSKNLIIPAGPAEVMGAKGAPSRGTAPVNQVGMSNGGRALYQAIHDKVKANPTSFAESRMIIDSLSTGSTDHVISQLKKLASDTTFMLDPNSRNELLLAVHAIEGAPQGQRPTLINMLRFQLIQMATAGREDALGAALGNVPAAAAASTATAKPGAEEKPKKE